MATTRQGSQIPSQDSAPEIPSPQPPARKRGAPEPQTPTKQGRAKKRKSSPSSSNHTTAPADTEEAEQGQPLPRLTTPDLEFDWDRSKLKDPRPTPGRERRPRYDEFDIPAELAARRPPSPKKPKGRMNAAKEDALFDEKTRRDPATCFHDLYKCRDKGRAGSPTYDSAGFRLDYDNVMDWFKPRAYSKSRVVKGMEKSVARAQSLEQHMFQAFFVEDLKTIKEKSKHSPGLVLEGLVKDTISKDLGIPAHKIGYAEIDIWAQKGFPKHKVEDWLDFSDEEKRRHSKMLQGASLRA